jgi:hypothetical protein
VSELVEFLRARLDEDEEYGPCDGWEEYLACDRFSRQRAKDIEAKRRIIERYVGIQGYAARDYDSESTDEEARVRRGGYLHALEVVLEAIAAIYADHPDYQQEWKP